MTSSIQKKKILLVDDEEDFLNVLKSRLEARHYEVVAATDGFQCLAMVGLEKPDVILLDLAMPNLDGYNVVKELKANPATEQVPVIIITGKNGTRDLLEMEGVADFIAKPFRTEDLIDRIESAASKQRKSHG